MRPKVNRLMRMQSFTHLGVVAAVALMSSTMLLASGQSGDRPAMTEPGHWVPLTVTYETTHWNPADPADRRVERRVEVHRADGSRRLTVLTDEEGLTKLIRIKNVAQQRKFTFRDGRWTAAHWPRPVHRKPFRRVNPNTMTRISIEDPRLAAIVAGGAPCTPYRLVHGTSDVLVCPELNMLNVWQRTATNERKVTQIVMDADDALFEPPPGAVIEER